MAINILEMLQNAIGKDLSLHASKLLGQTETTTHAALNAGLPALLGGLMSKASTLSGATDLINMIRGPAVNSDLLLKDLAGLFGGDESTTRHTSLGTTLLNIVYGEKQSAVADAVGSTAGIPGNVAKGLLSMLAPLLFSFLKGQVAKNNLGPSELMGLLAEQTDFLHGHLSDAVTTALGFGPASVFLADMRDKLLGVAKSTGTARSTSAGALPPVGLPPRRPSASSYSTLKRLRPWIILAFGIPLFFLFRSCGESNLEEQDTGRSKVEVPTTKPTVLPTATVVPTPVPTERPAPTAVPPTTIPAPTVVPSPAPKAETAPPTTTKKGAAATPSAVRIYFDIGKSKLPTNVDTVLQTIVDYAKAHKKAVVTIAGFHDATGNQAKNAALAKRRAMAVQERLVSRGVSKAQIVMRKPEVTTGSGDQDQARRVEVNAR